MPKILVNFDTTCDDNDGEPVSLTEDMASFGGESGDRFRPVSIKNDKDALYEVADADMDAFFDALEEDANWCYEGARVLHAEEG